MKVYLINENITIKVHIYINNIYLLNICQIIIKTSRIEFFLFDFTDYFSLKENDIMSLKTVYNLKDYSSVYINLMNTNFDFSFEYLINHFVLLQNQKDFVVDPNNVEKKPSCII